jgi:hypothetical protein
MHPKYTPKDIVRFWSHVRKTDSCWEWTSLERVNGYGKFTFGGRRGKQVRAHRFSYELTVGPIPKGLVLDHLCRNTLCVNPAHLEIVTRAENIHRGENPNILIHHGDFCSKGHRLTPENVYLNPNKRCSSGFARRCRTCMREYEKRRVRSKSNASS